MNTNLSLRVGKYDWKNRQIPQTEGYTNILIHTQEALSPFILKDDQNVIMENYWQFSKLYAKVYRIKQKISNYSAGIRWQYPTELHVDNQNHPNEAYWKWRHSGMTNPHWVRYPNGYQHRKEVIGSVVGTPEQHQILDYITARKQIYFSKYRETAIITPEFQALKQRLLSGEKLQIVEVDGPSYQPEYPYNLVSNGSIPITQEILVALINNPQQNFGHGYCLCACLMDLDLSQV